MDLVSRLFSYVLVLFGIVMTGWGALGLLEYFTGLAVIARQGLEVGMPLLVEHAHALGEDRLDQRPVVRPFRVEQGQRPRHPPPRAEPAAVPRRAEPLQRLADPRLVDDVDRHGVVRVIVGTIPLKLDAKHLEKT